MRVAFLFTFATMLVCAAAYAQQQVVLPPSQPYLSVSGTGEVKSAPDTAYVVVGVVTDAKRASDAAQANAAASQRVLDALKAQGISPKDLQTAQYSVQPVYKENTSPQTIVGFRVSNQVRATVLKPEAVGAVIDAAMGAGANSVDDVSFGITDRQALEDQALAEAIGGAKRKAEAMARAAGIELGAIRLVQGGAEAPQPRFFGGIGGMSARVATPVSPGELTVSASVTVEFDILHRTAAAVAEPESKATSAELSAQHDKLASELDDMLTRYSDKHPEVVALRAQIASVDQLLASRRQADLRAALDELVRKRDEMATMYSDKHPLMVNIETRIADITRQLQEK